jgi:tRNA (adenine57-N1/adenine58-N1)-methyltransferase
MPFTAGDPALLIDAKGRQFLLKLDPERTFQYHQGSIPHRDLIGKEDGSWVESSGGGSLLLISPRLADYVLKMKRSAQVVYPKDLGPILVYADIAPGQTVLEAGTGSGALTLGLSRAVGPTGRVVSVEAREDHAAHARKAIERWYGEIPANLELVVGDVVEQVERVAPERIILDLSEPWRVLQAAGEHLPGGGVLCAYLPTVPQLQTLVEQANADGRFAGIEVKEFLVRDWNVAGRSVRPEHSMVGHTGFLVFMRRVDAAPGHAAEPL